MSKRSFYSLLSVAVVGVLLAIMLFPLSLFAHGGGPRRQTSSTTMRTARTRCGTFESTTPKGLESSGRKGSRRRRLHHRQRRRAHLRQFARLREPDGQAHAGHRPEWRRRHGLTPVRAVEAPPDRQPLPDNGERHRGLERERRIAPGEEDRPPLTVTVDKRGRCRRADPAVAAARGWHRR